MERRKFIKNVGLLTTVPLTGSLSSFTTPSASKKIKVALVGTGSRGSSLWGTTIRQSFPDIEFVGLSDINLGRLNHVKGLLKVDCPVFTNYDEMLRKTNPDYVMVATTDYTHDEMIVKALNAGFNVITEKPMATDEAKCKRILDAEKRSGKEVIVTFNYRHAMHPMKLKELLAKNIAGDIVSVDFNWYLNTYHGADYFRRWHGIMAKSGSLWVHKATHHFDLLNWWLNSEPVEVMAYGSLDFYGKNNSFRGTKCRGCLHQSKCDYYYDITQNQGYMDLYVKNEHYDGYLRDGCVWRNEIDIFDKMSAQIKYANGILANYSLTTYSPYEGWQIAFNGKKGRVETWEDIPYLQKVNTDQAKRHATEMSNSDDVIEGDVNEIFVMDNFKKNFQIYTTPKIAAGHGGGDIRMLRRIFTDTKDNPHHVMAGTREGAMSILIGIAARKSVKERRPVKISELTDLVPKAKRF